MQFVIPNSVGSEIQEANPCHNPGGSPAGGEFCSASRSSPKGTVAEVRALKRYLGNEDAPEGVYIPDGVNGLLRGVSRYDNVLAPTQAQAAYYRRQTALLQQLIEKTPTTTDQVFYRGVTKKLVDVLKDGTVFLDRGFTSVAADKGIAQERFTGFGEKGGRVYEVRVPKGTPLLDVDRLTNPSGDREYTTETEHLLGRGTRFRVQGHVLMVLR